MGDNSLITQSQLQSDLENFYNTKVYPYLNGATHAGCVPVGSRLDGWFPTTPKYYLYCDGAEYLKSDYPELAELLAQVDEINSTTQYVGSDANHFKVPDVRGEFIRGTGINSHTNQGSGAGVGVHQDGTTVPYTIQISPNKLRYYAPEDASEYNYVQNYDYSNKMTCDLVEATTSVVVDSYPSITSTVNTRPTNTSLPQYICYKTHYIDLALDSFPIDISNPTDGQLLMYDATAGRWVNGGHKYSTDEHIVGTWIDGKPIYEKTFSAIENAQCVTDGAVVLKYVEIGTLVDTIVEIRSIRYNQSSQYRQISPRWTYENIAYDICAYSNGASANKNTIRFSNNAISENGLHFNITLQYTKTTDTAQS